MLHLSSILSQASLSKGLYGSFLPGGEDAALSRLGDAAGEGLLRRLGDSGLFLFGDGLLRLGDLAGEGLLRLGEGLLRFGEGLLRAPGDGLLRLGEGLRLRLRLRAGERLLLRAGERDRSRLRAGGERLRRLSAAGLLLRRRAGLLSRRLEEEERGERLRLRGGLLVRL